MVFLAVLPIIVVAVLMTVFMKPALKSMAVGYVIAALVALFFWKMQFPVFMAVTVSGCLKAMSILTIVFGAMLLLFTLQESGATGVIAGSFFNVSRDRRIQVIIIGWLFSGFIEGAAGFGTPAMLSAPLLLFLGFPTSAAIMLPLIFNSTAVSFGGAGVPITRGIAETLQQIDKMSLLPEVTFFTALIHGVVGTFVPLLGLCLMTKFYGRNRTVKEGLAAWKFAIFAGMAFTVPYFLIARFLGPELPSLLAGLVALPVVITAARKGFLTPAATWDFPSIESGNKDRCGKLTATGETSSGSSISLLMAWTPYMLTALILIVTRLDFFRIKSILLNHANIDLQNIFGTTVGFSEKVLYNPGIIPFIVISLVTVILHRMNRGMIKEVWKHAISRIVSPAVALMFAVAMVQILTQKTEQHPSMIFLIADSLSRAIGRAWPFFSPVVGIMGAFVAGSNTVSNLLFSGLQWEVAQNLHISGSVILALQNVGGAIGNMICPHNVVAVCAVAGFLGKEGLIIKRNLIAVIIYWVLAGTIGTLLI